MTHLMANTGLLLLPLLALGACSSPAKTAARDIDWSDIHGSYTTSYSADKSATLASITVGK